MADKYFLGDYNAYWSDDYDYGAHSSNWYTDNTGYNPTSKPTTGDKAWIYADCTLNENTAELAGLVVYEDDVTLTVQAGQDVTITIQDGTDLEIQSSGTLTAHPDSDKVHTIDFEAASDGNCKLIVSGTLDLEGDAAWRTGDASGIWCTSMSADRSSSDSTVTIPLNDDLDLNSTQVTNGDLYVIIGASEGWSEGENLQVTGYTSGGSPSLTVASLDYDHYAGSDVCVVSRNCRILSSGAGAWRLNSSGTTSCTEVDMGEGRHHAATETDSFVNCYFLGPNYSSRFSDFYGDMGNIYFDECLFENVLHIAYRKGDHHDIQSFYNCHLHHTEDAGYLPLATFAGEASYVWWYGGVINADFTKSSSALSGTENVVRIINARVVVTGRITTTTVIFIGCVMLPTGDDVETRMYNGLTTLIGCEMKEPNSTHWDYSYGGTLWCIDHDGTINNNLWYLDTALVQPTKTATDTYNGTGTAIDIDPHEDATANAPFRIPISKYRCRAGDTISFSCRCACDSTYYALTDRNPTITIFQGDYLGTEADTTITLEDPGAGDPADHYVQGSISSQTVDGSSSDGWVVVEAFIDVPGNAGHIFVDDISWSGGTEDAEAVDSWPMNVIGEAAAGGGGGGVTRRLAKVMGAN